MTDHSQSMPADWDEELDGIWEGVTDEAMDKDLELITSFLNGHLDPARIEAVKQRLAEDEHFRDLAAPLLLAWSVPRHIERHPRPAGELERDWEEFKRRSGFPHRPPEPPAPPPSRWHRVRHWRHWKGLRVLTLLLIGAYMIGAQMMLSALEDPGYDEREFSLVPYDTGWVSLNDGIEVRLSPGASLRLGHRRLDGMSHVMLDGTARFRISPLDTAAPVLRTRAIQIDTRGGSVIAGESNISVVARADTTEVHVHALGLRRALMPHLRTVVAYTQVNDMTASIVLNDLERARLVRGHDPALLTNPR